MVFEPVGPLPASTYWRRRAVLLAVVVVLLFLLRSCVGGGGGDKDDQLGTTPSATPTPSATVASAPSTTPSRAPTVAVGGQCTDAALKLVVTTDADSYPVGGTPTFTLTVTNTSAATCTRDLGSKAVSLRVISGTARTWDSDDCSEGEESKATRLAPGTAVKVIDAYTWSGKRSRPGCPLPRDEAAAGTYQVSGTVGSLTSARVVFHFR